MPTTTGRLWMKKFSSERYRRAFDMADMPDMPDLGMGPRFSNVSTHGTTNDGATVLVLDLTHASGSLAVVGRPGRIGLG